MPFACASGLLQATSPASFAFSTAIRSSAVVLSGGRGSSRADDEVWPGGRLAPLSMDPSWQPDGHDLFGDGTVRRRSGRTASAPRSAAASPLAGHGVPGEPGQVSGGPGAWGPGAWGPGAWGQTEFQVNLKLGLTPRRRCGSSPAASSPRVTILRSVILPPPLVKTNELQELADIDWSSPRSFFS